MTNQQRSSKRRSFPPYDESSKLSRRDQTLVRVDKLLSEQFIVPLQDEVPLEEDGPVELVDLAEAVETAQLPPEARPQARTLAPPRTRTPSAESPAGTPTPMAAPAPEKKSRLSVFSAVLQAAILIFVLAWVFLLGILVGRGHLWQSGLGHDLVVWVEQKAGWTDKGGPEVVLKKDNQPDVVIPPAGPADTPTETAPEQSPDLAPAGASDSEEQAEERDAMPVWDWGDWRPGDPVAGEVSEETNATSTPETAPSIDSQTSASPAPAAETEEETWPTAIEDEEDPGPAVEYQPPGDQDDYDYEAMLEPAEVPNATLAEATPLPPELVAGAPGAGKFVIQVSEAADEDEAKRKVAQLAAQGFSAYYFDGGNGRFPVRVGRFPTHQDANVAKVLLEGQGYKGLDVSALSN